MSWNEERVERLRELWGKGLSASQIADEIGEVTRNAVIGKIHRLGLSERADGATPSAAKPKRSTAKAKASTKPSSTAVRVKKPSSASLPAPEKPASDGPPPALRLNLLELTEATCKWPIGDPGDDDFHFCGHPAQSGIPYCSHHARMAYQPPAERKRKRA